jgi:cell division protein FtsN
MNGGAPSYTYSNAPQNQNQMLPQQPQAPQQQYQQQQPQYPQQQQQQYQPQQEQQSQQQQPQYQTQPQQRASQPQRQQQVPQQQQQVPQQQQQVPQQRAPAWQPNYNLPPAVVKPAMPPANSYHIYRVQVGAYKSTVNAREVFDHLVTLGFTPAYERYGDMYRVVLSGVRAQDLPEVARLIGYAGLREIIIRAEN